MKIINYRNLNTIFIVKNFFNLNQINSLFDNINIKQEEFIFKNFGKVIPSLFCKHSLLISKLKIRKIENILSDYFGFTTIATNHSDYHINTYGNWHNDCGLKNSYLPKNFYKKNTYSDIFKCAVYNQAGIESPAEFKLQNEIINAPLEIGDLLIFRIELTHRSRKINRIFHFLKFFFFLINKYKLQNNNLRKAIFFTIGKKGNSLEFFYKKNLEREKIQIKNAIRF